MTFSITSILKGIQPFRNIILILFILVSAFVLGKSQNSFIIKGYLSGIDDNSLVGATVLDTISKIGVTTNEQGYFYITLKQANAVLSLSHVGYNTLLKSVLIKGTTELNIKLTPLTLDEVIVSSHRNRNRINEIRRPEEISMETIERIPSIIGEPDVLKALSILPGISQTSDISTNLTVRGASHSQNLIIMDEAPHYQTGHLFGFTSLFNYEAVKDIKLYKNIIPAKYGGALSSVIELHSKNGNPDSLSGSYSFGLINSGISLSGPLSKSNKINYFVAARSMYVGLLTLPLYYLYSIGDINTFLTYYMYDVNINLTWKPSSDETLSFYYFTGIDNLNSKQRNQDNLETKGLIVWGTNTAGLSYKKLISSNTFLKSHLTYSKSFNQTGVIVDESDLQEKINLKRISNLENLRLKSYIEVYRTQHEVSLGIETSYNNITPSKTTQEGKLYSNVTNRYSYHQVDLFADDLWSFAPQWSLYYGLRWSNYLLLPKQESRLEPRLSLHYSWIDPWGISIGYQRLAQYNFLAPITNLGLPNDIWLSIKDEMFPSIMNQFFLNIAGEPSAQGIQFELDLFYRRYKNLNEIINRTSFILGLPYDWSELIQNDGYGIGYGFELNLNYNSKLFSSSLAYTFLNSQYRYSKINNGQWFAGQYDIRNQLNASFYLQLSKRWRFTALYDIKSGRPVTVPKEIIIGPSGEEIIVYGSKNASRLGLYHRLDIGFLKKYTSKKGRAKTLSFSIYNTYFRYNPFYYTYTRQKYNGTDLVDIQPFLNQFGFLPLIPSISYKVKF